MGTTITMAGLNALKDLKELRSLYLYQTKVNKEDWTTLQKEFPKTLVDSGGYNVPLLPNDTVVLKAPVYK